LNVQGLYTKFNTADVTSRDRKVKVTRVLR